MVAHAGFILWKILYGYVDEFRWVGRKDASAFTLLPRRSILAGLVGLWGGMILGLPIWAWAETTGPHLPPDWPLPITLIFCLGWSFAGLNLLWHVLWNVFGQEDLVVSSTTLTRQWRMLLFGRTYSFLIQKISSLRLHEQRRAKGIVLRYLACDYDGRQARLTSQLEDGEDAALLNGPLSGLLDGSTKEVS